MYETLHRDSSLNDYYKTVSLRLGGVKSEEPLGIDFIAVNRIDLDGSAICLEALFDDEILDFRVDLKRSDRWRAAEAPDYILGGRIVFHLKAVMRHAQRLLKHAAASTAQAILVDRLRIVQKLGEGAR